MSKLFTVVAGLILSQATLATTFYEVTIPDIYKESELVIYGKIEAGRILADNCGVEYGVRVQTFFKGSADAGQLVWFQNGGVTQVGGLYFLFLSRTGKEFTPVASTNSSSMDAQRQYIEQCKDKRPPYVVKVFGNGALNSVRTFSKSAPRAVVIDDGVLIPPDGLKLTKFGPYDRYDNDRDDTALDLDEFMEYMKGSPNAH